MPSRIGHPQRKATSGRSPALLPNLINYPHSLEAYFKHEESSPRFPPPRHTSPRLYLLAQMVPHPFLHGSLLRGMVMGGLERKEWPPPGLGGDRGALGRLAA